MPTDRSTSGVSPSKSRLERNASFIPVNLNVENSILQHRTFFSRSAPHAPTSGQRGQTSRLGRRARQPTSDQTALVAQDAEYSLGVTNLCGFGELQLLRFSRHPFLSQSEPPWRNRRLIGPGRRHGQFQPGTRSSEVCLRWPGEQTDKS